MASSPQFSVVGYGTDDQLFVSRTDKKGILQMAGAFSGKPLNDSEHERSSTPSPHRRHS